MTLADSGRCSLGRLHFTPASIFISLVLACHPGEERRIRYTTVRGVGKRVRDRGGMDGGGGVRRSTVVARVLLRGIQTWSNDASGRRESKESMHSYGSFCLNCCSKNCTRKKELVGAFPARKHIGLTPRIVCSLLIMDDVPFHHLEGIRWVCKGRRWSASNSRWGRAQTKCK